jgi:hypothetical protein
MVDREIYKHLLVTDHTKKIKPHWSTSTLSMFIKPGGKEDQKNFYVTGIMVALLENGDLVYVSNGLVTTRTEYLDHIYIGKGVIHHMEDV